MPSEIMIATIGHCIYCGAQPTEAELTVEHIIPFALGGTYVLGEASCATCQEITKHIEQNVLRPMLGLARVRLDLQTRRKKDRGGKFRTTLHKRNDDDEVIYVAPDELPAYVFLPYFDRPGLLVGRGPTLEIPILEWWGYLFDPDPDGMLKKLANQFGGGQIMLGRLRLDEFGRMLAKIGHAAAAGYIGLDQFEPLLPNIVLKTDNEISLYVGGSHERPPREGKHLRMELGWVNGPTKEFLLASIRLFPLLGAPVYQVVVGRRPP